MEMEKNKKNKYGFDFTPMVLDIKTFREAQKITREKLAETLDITPRHLQAIELEGKHPSLGLLAYIATIFDMPIDPYIFPDKADAKSAVRKRLDVLLDKLSYRDLSILEDIGEGNQEGSLLTLSSPVQPSFIIVYWC